MRAEEVAWATGITVVLVALIAGIFGLAWHVNTINNEKSREWFDNLAELTMTCTEHGGAWIDSAAYGGYGTCTNGGAE